MTKQNQTKHQNGPINTEWVESEGSQRHQAWWCTFAIQATGRLRQEDHEFEDSLDYRANLRPAYTIQWDPVWKTNKPKATGTTTKTVSRPWQLHSSILQNISGRKDVTLTFSLYMFYIYMCVCVCKYIYSYTLYPLYVYIKKDNSSLPFLWRQNLVRSWQEMKHSQY
jgi:hypothetical protein